jgi:hypothetical protein
MKRLPPLKFALWAAVVPNDAGFPLDEKQTYFVAASDTDFQALLAPYASLISAKYVVTRIEPAHANIPIVVTCISPVTITWSEQVPMYLEIYHQGKAVRTGYFSSGDLHPIDPSPIPYEIKMSRKKDFPQRNTWILVEEKKR